MVRACISLVVCIRLSVWCVFQAFVVPLRYDGISAGFELLDHRAVHLSRRIRTALHEIRSRTQSDPSWIPAEPVRDNSYSVTVCAQPATHTHTRTHAHTHIHTLSHTHTHARTHARTHTHYVLLTRFRRSTIR